MAGVSVTHLWETHTFSVSPSGAELWHCCCGVTCDGNHINLEPRLNLTRPNQLLLSPRTPELKWSPTTQGTEGIWLPQQLPRHAGWWYKSLSSELPVREPLSMREKRSFTFPPLFHDSKAWWWCLAHLETLLMAEQLAVCLVKLQVVW